MALVSKSTKTKSVQDHHQNLDIKFFKYKRDKEGRCNICGSKKRLSYDHVPPQGCTTVEAIEVVTILRAMTGNVEGKLATLQDGLKFRTICSDCNSLLGERYDRALADFIRYLRTFLSSKLVLPKTASIRCRPNAIVRGVLGHLMASKVTAQDSLFDEEVRECVLNSEAPIPEKYFISYWMYPHKHTVVMRDSLLMDIRQEGRGYFLQLMKFSPIGFAVVSDNQLPEAHLFAPYHGIRWDQEEEISVEVSSIRAADWPEAPHGPYITFMGEAGAASAFARPKRK